MGFKIIYIVAIYTRHFNRALSFNNRPTKEQIDQALSEHLSETDQTELHNLLIPSKYEIHIIESKLYEV